MSHEITENDRHEGIEMAWHGLTHVESVILLSTCWLALWDALKRPLYRIYTDMNGQTVTEETDTCEIVCTDNPKLAIGKPVNIASYFLLTNARFRQIVQDSMDKLPGAFVASVLSCCNRARVAIALAIPQNLNPQTFATNVSPIAATFTLQAASREFKFFLNFLHSFDKSCTFLVNMSTVCTVCNNTFNMNLQDNNGDKLRISIPHTKNMSAALNDVPAIVAAFFVSAQKFAEIMNGLEQVPCDAPTAKAFIVAFLAEKDESQEDGEETETEVSQISTRRENRIDRILSLFVSGKGNNGVNFADLFSAFTDFYSHESAGGDDKMKQVASSEFGNGQTMKAAAFAILSDDKKTAKLIAKGQKILSGQKDEAPSA